MKKLYYVVEKELQMINDCEEASGIKFVNVYEIENDEPKLLVGLDLHNESNTIKSIQEFLSENDFTEDFTLIQL